MRKYMLMALLLLVAVPIWAQQTRVNIQYDPQRNTEGILPFSTQVLSPEVRDDHTVIFRVKAPDAKSVQLTGSMFVGKEARKRVDFTKGDDGVWTLTLGPLTPEIYFYYIIIDGVQNIDANNEFTGHAAMPSFSMLFVHGDKPTWYDPKPDVPHGSITTHYYLVMHGRANFILDNIIAEGRAREMIVCFPNDQMVTRSHPKHTELAFPLVERELLECVIPFVESHYSVIKDRHARALSGLSMGGRMTQYVALRNLDVFGSMGILSAAIDLSETPVVNEPDVNDRIDYLFIGGGTYETGFMARHERLHEQLDKLGVKNDYYVGGGGAHDLVTWRHLLYDRFLPNLWRNNYKWK